ncbi:MAG: toll/interleukin-1 receptor domain-containing protein [Bacteroidetes bacterium]|nr:toll/interleukin-1 receptor domain-containing protein [Bacteroidota bacterium]MCW5896793.1 toll/interleukin-1 receptor domain-containing protein [Bacteroidota bacterium]
MLTLKRLAIYLIAYLLTVVVVIGLINWKWMDTWLVHKANTAGESGEIVNNKLVLVNLEKPATGSEGEAFRLFRQRVVQFLNTVARESRSNNSPAGVVLDIWFSRDTTELENLKSALDKLKDLRVPVYASYNIRAGHEEADLTQIDFGEIEEKHAIEIYNAYLAGSDGQQPGSGRYHTYIYPRNEGDMATYENDIHLPSAMFDTVWIESLARRVATDLGDSRHRRHEPKREGSIIPFGSMEEMQRITYTFVPDSQETGRLKDSQATDGRVNLSNKIIVVGDAENDIVTVGSRKVPGPYIVTWALSDNLEGSTRLKLPVENRYAIVGQLLFFSFFSVLIFALLFKYVKALQTKPAVIAILAFTAGVALLALFGFILLGSGNVIPVGQTLAAMLAAVLLSLRFTYKFFVTGVVEGSQKYDVFISYSHSQTEWVKKNVYEPLAAFRKPNGDRLNIFFDQNSIGVGEAFTAKYMWAIVDTKCFVPVISEDYYGKNHCRNELDCAMKRWVEKLLSIQALAFSFKAVPEAYNGINYIDINQNPDFIGVITQNLHK